MKNLLVIVDVQNDFCSDGGVLANDETIAAAKKISKFLETNDGLFEKIVCTLDTHFANYFNTVEGKHLPVEHCQKGNWGWKIEEGLYRALYYCLNTSFVEKRNFSPFLEDMIMAMQEGIGSMADCPYDRIYVFGVCTDICVINTVFMLKNAFEKEVYVIEDCCAGSCPENHNAALKVMAASHVNIVKVTDFINEKAE